MIKKGEEVDLIQESNMEIEKKGQMRKEWQRLDSGLVIEQKTKGGVNCCLQDFLSGERGKLREGKKTWFILGHN